MTELYGLLQNNSSSGSGSGSGQIEGSAATWQYFWEYASLAGITGMATSSMIQSLPASF